MSSNPNYIKEMAMSASLRNMSKGLQDEVNRSNDPHLVAHMTRTSGQLTPISHPRLMNRYRVVMMKQPSPSMNYVMFVGDGYVRVFTDETLPDDLRFRMMTIDTYADGHASENTRQDFIHTVPPPLNEIYNNGLGEAMDEIGWRSHEYYCFVMTYDELMAYRGEHGKGSPMLEYMFVTDHNKEARKQVYETAVRAK